MILLKFEETTPTGDMPKPSLTPRPVVQHRFLLIAQVDVRRSGDLGDDTSRAPNWTPRARDRSVLLEAGMSDAVLGEYSNTHMRIRSFDSEYTFVVATGLRCFDSLWTREHLSSSGAPATSVGCKWMSQTPFTGFPSVKRRRDEPRHVTDTIER